MPLGKTQYLAIDTMAGNDTNKYTVFNDAVEKLDDAINRILSVDMSSSDYTLTETELTSNGVYESTGNAVARTLFIPVTVSTPATATHRTFLVRNSGTFDLIIAHVGTPGSSITVGVGATVGCFCDGTDVSDVASSVSGGVQVSDDGISVVPVATEIDFVGAGVTVTDVAGVATVTVSSSSSATSDLQVTAGEALGAFKAVTVSGMLCDSVSPDLELYAGITTTAHAFGALATVTKEGLVTESSWTWTPNAPIFITTGGILTQTPPPTPLRRIAFATSSTEINLDPFPTIGA